MKAGKIFWGIIGILGLGFVVFNNFDSTIQSVQQNSLKLIALILALIVSVVYGMQNKEVILCQKKF